MYKKTVTTNSSLSRQNTNSVLVFKSGQVQLHLTFNCYFIYEDILANHIEMTIMIHDLLSILSHQCLYFTDIKYKYQVVNVYPDNYHYLVFYIPRISQVQSICMPQGAKILFLTFDGFINIILRLIPSPQPEFLLFYRKTTKNTVPLIFYIDDIFRTFKTQPKQHVFLQNYFFMHDLVQIKASIFQA